MDFLLVLIEFFASCTAEALQAKTDWKLEFYNGAGELQPNFRVQGDAPSQSFLNA